MEINSITFNGKNSLDFGLYVSGNQTFNSAEKDYSKVSVPGRSGDLLLFNNRYKNVNVNYDAILIEDYEKNAEKVRSWLLSANGYCRLEDTYHPDEFRMASFSGPVDFDTKMLEAGETTLTFDCKPQRWLKSGENWISCEDGPNGFTATLSNPTLFESKPLIKLEGYGTIEIGTGIIEIRGDIIDVPTTIYVDCETMNCFYYDNNSEVPKNANKYVIISKWPTLLPGDTYVHSNAVGFHIQPRWWTL